MPAGAAPPRRTQFKRNLAKKFRANPTDAERKLWALLRAKQFGGLRFRRQQPIGPYIVDFFCPSEKLIVELDGDQHSTDTNAAYDATRTRWLEERGYRVLRMTNHEVLRGKPVEIVCSAIEAYRPSPNGPWPFDPPSGGG